MCMSCTDATILNVSLEVGQCVPVHVSLFFFSCVCKCEAQIYFLAARLSDRKRGRAIFIEVLLVGLL